ncbi:MAG: DUF4396 domain-containing protein [Chitinophagales bacterium]|nr:DUF4396 domain-containing protein [Chitinophagales bacterium]MDW8418739.1 DUF4396 domain-containing protein [Chitinophagales bacterium]
MLKTITLPTNLHCNACVEKIKPVMNNAPRIKEWSVDLSGSTKTITVSGEDITEEMIDMLLHQAGYAVIPTNSNSSALPPIGHLQQSSGFWSDREKWKRAIFNTLNCLIGCSIGDFGALLYLQWKHPHIGMGLQMLIAILAGLCTSILLETVILRVREKFDWKSAFGTAMSMSFISMITMEIAMNLTDFMITGGKAAFNTPAYWLAFLPAALAGFITPLPYNYYKLKKYNRACH